MLLPWAAVVDFDGTLIEADVGDTLSRRHAGREVWQRADDAYRRRAIDFAELIRQQFGNMRVDRANLAAAALALGRVRPGFVALAETLLAAGRPVVICSAGLDAYIHPILTTLPDGLGARLEVFCNRAEWAGDRLRVVFAGADLAGGCTACGSCKAAVVREVQRRGFRVAYVGDGISDRCAVGAADLVFARDGLQEICTAEGLPFLPWQDFIAVRAAWPETLA
jgi:2-hydroxy-3-keto-5-methylthiopentenyl-1-phosphate phosphatase